MTGQELLELARVYLSDDTTPYLWSDELILRHLNEAQKVFCEKTHALLDIAVTVSATASTATYNLPQNVLRVYAARISGDNTQLARTRGEAYAMSMLDTLSEPRYFSTSVGDRKLTLYPVPDGTYSIELICAIRPSTVLTEDNSPSIAEEYHENLVDFACYKCLITNDVDGNNTGTAMEFRARWEDFIRDTKRDIYRYRTGDKLVVQNWTWGRNGV